MIEMGIHGQHPAAGAPKTCFGPPREWHLLLPNAFEHLTFGHVPRLHEAVVRLGPALPAARLVAVWAIGDPVTGDRSKQYLVEDVAESTVVFAQQSNHRLESFQGLHRPLEADRPRI